MSTEDPQSYQPSTPLMEAVLLDDQAEAYRWTKELLEAGEDPNQIDSIYLRTPLFAAWCENRPQLVHLLLDFGASAQVELSSFDEVMIGNASIQTSLPICKAGFRFDSLLTTNQLGETMCESYSNPIEYFLEQGLWDHIEAFKPFGIMNLIHAFDGMLGKQPLANMAREGLEKQVKWLLEHGADVNAHCNGMIGSTALEEAVDSRNLNIIKLLLNAGANPNIPTWMWQTCTDRVSRFGSAKRKPHHNSSKDSDLVEIRKLILDASKMYPPPTYPDGTTPDVWPPVHKSK